MSNLLKIVCLVSGALVAGLLIKKSQESDEEEKSTDYNKGYIDGYNDGYDEGRSS